MFTGDCLPGRNMLYCPACRIILPHPWGKLIKTQLFGKHHFKGFCENVVFLILTQICSQKIKDSQSILINSSIFMVSPPRSQEKRWLTLPHFPLPIPTIPLQTYHPTQLSSTICYGTVHWGFLRQFAELSPKSGKMCMFSYTVSTSVE